MISALQVLAVMKSTGAGLAELCAPMPKYPQVLLNVRVAPRFDPMESPERRRDVAAVERTFNGRGRIVLRASGTEPLIRVMVEGYEAKMVKPGAREIAAAVEAVAAKPAQRARWRRLRDLQLPVHAANLRRLSGRGACSPIGGGYASSGGRG